MSVAIFGFNILRVSVAAVFLAGCSQIEPYSEPEANLPPEFAQASGGSVGETATVLWWQAFNDDKLDQLVTRGLTQNIGIQIAGERFRAAQAVARGAGVPVSGGLLAEGGGRGSTNGPEEGFVTGTANVSWLLDFYGRLSSERTAAGANFEAAGYDVESARLAYLAELTTAYVNARYFQNLLEITRRNLSSRNATVDLTQRLVDASAATVVDLSQARGFVDETRADIPTIEGQFLVWAHRVSTLLGQPAGDWVPYLSAGAAQPVAGRIYRGGVPADLLRNRPDIRAAERNLAASVARIGVARADLFPSISLGGRITGNAGTNSADVATWSFGPIINLAIFGREQLNATVNQREAQAREQLLVWQNTVLLAVEEVENALALVSRSGRAITAEKQALGSLQESLDLQRSAFERGERSILDVIDAERRVGEARSRLAAAQQRHAVNFIALNVAIGSGRGLAGTQQVAADES